jgi:hypothetical protein
VRRGVLPASIFVGVLLLVSACAKLGSDNERAQTQEATSTSSQTPPHVNPHRYGGQANYFTNPSFETRIAPWHGWGANSIVEITKETSKIGRASARVSASSGTAYGIYEANVVSLPARNDRFTFSVWLRSGDRPKTVTVTLQASRPKAAALVLAHSSPVITPGAWRQVSLEARVDKSNVSGIDAYVLVQNSIGTGDSFFIDGASLTRA